MTKLYTYVLVSCPFLPLDADTRCLSSSKGIRPNEEKSHRHGREEPLFLGYQLWMWSYILGMKWKKCENNLARSNDKKFKCSRFIWNLENRLNTAFNQEDTAIASDKIDASTCTQRWGTYPVFIHLSDEYKNNLWWKLIMTITKLLEIRINIRRLTSISVTCSHAHLNYLNS